MKQSKRRYYRIVKKTFPDGEANFFIQYRHKGWDGAITTLLNGWFEYDSSPYHFLQEAEFALEGKIEEDNAGYDAEQRQKKAKTEIVG